MKRYTAKVKQDGVEVAYVNCPDEESMQREIMHYAAVYAQDGPVTIVMQEQSVPYSAGDNAQ